MSCWAPPPRASSPGAARGPGVFGGDRQDDMGREWGEGRCREEVLATKQGCHPRREGHRAVEVGDADTGKNVWSNKSRLAK